MTTGTLRMTSLVAALALLLAASAQAQTVRRDTNNPALALGIDGLVVDGEAYDVTFEFSDATLFGPQPGTVSCPEPYDPPVPWETLPFDEVDAQQANEAIAAALDAAQDPEIVGVTSIGSAAYEINVTYAPSCFESGVGSANVITISGETPKKIPVTDCPNGPPFCDPEFGPSGSWGVLLTIPRGEDEAQQASSVRTWVQPVFWATFVPADGSPGEPLPPVIEFFSGDPTVIEAGDDTTLSWSALNATSCEGSGGTGNWAGAKAASGSELISSISASTTFRLSCTGDGGTKDATPVTVTVEPSQNYPIDVPTSGTKQVMPSVSTRYRLSCDGPGGTSTQDVTVSVEGPVGGTVEGLPNGDSRVACRVKPDRYVREDLTAGAWDCWAMGARVPQANEWVIMRLKGSATGNAVKGTVSGLGGNVVQCSNKTSGLKVKKKLGDALDWDCAAAGLSINAGDDISVKIRGDASN